MAESTEEYLARLEKSGTEIIKDFALLKQVSRETTWEEVERLNLVERLKKACDGAWVTGHGLAAIQIGVPVRFAWFKNGTRDIFLLNPKIIEMKGKVKLKNEGCLSIPGKWSAVKRAEKIRYESDGEIKTARGPIAHIIQHEIDHMNGVLNADIAVRTWRVVVR
jgi:peptide deformylase